MALDDARRHNIVVVAGDVVAGDEDPVEPCVLAVDRTCPSAHVARPRHGRGADAIADLTARPEQEIVQSVAQSDSAEEGVSLDDPQEVE